MSARERESQEPLHDTLRKHGIDPTKVPCGAYAPPEWVPVIDRLVSDLIAMGWDKDLHQVKSKFGGLRFYIGRGTQEIHTRIREAEDESRRIEYLSKLLWIK